MKNLAVLLLTIFSLSALSQEMEISSKIKKNIIYLKPFMNFMGKATFPVGGSEQISGLELGYSRELETKYAKPRQLDLRVGAIVPSFALSSPNTSGFMTNIEYRVIFKKAHYHTSNYLFYYSANLYHQYTKTKVDGEYEEYSKINDNQYSVFRHEIGLMPKIGIQFINRITGIYWDMGLAAGGRFVTSHNKNKISNFDTGEEPFVNKQFDYGSAFAQRISFQIKVGYNF